MSRVQLSDDVRSILFKMSEGNPGALTVMLQLLKKGEQIDPDSFMGGLGIILSLDTHEIYGSRIWMLYKDVCKEDIVSMVAVLRAVQLGYVSDASMKHAIYDHGAGLDIPGTITKVKTRLPKFGIAIAKAEGTDDMREEHDEFCSCDACRDDRELVDAERRADARRQG